MSPGGHLVMTLAACGAAGAVTQSWPVVAGVAAGGFFIDVDHAIDYVLFEGQRDLRPGVFLGYYVEGRVKRVVLGLHSYELFGLLAVVAWWSEWTPLWAYLAGAVLHLGLDIAFNGEFVPGNIVAFYSLVYRARHRFSGPALLSKDRREAAPDGFWRAFFRGAAPAPVAPSGERS